MTFDATVCPECYSEYPRITPFYNAEYCLKNHRQYKCKTCGRLICIEKNSEISIFAQFSSEKVARLLLRGAAAYHKQECAIFKKNNNERTYFVIHPVYGYLSRKTPAHFIPTTYRQPVKKQTGFISDAEITTYLSEQAKEKSSTDYSEILSCDVPENQTLSFSFISCKKGELKMQFKTRFEVFSRTFYDDENDSIENSSLINLAQWLNSVSKGEQIPEKEFFIYSEYGNGFFTIKKGDDRVSSYESYSEDEESLRISFFGSCKNIFDNFKNALKSFIENGYTPAEWERKNQASEEESDEYEGLSLSAIYEHIERL